MAQKQYRHFDFEERKIIEKMYKLGAPITAIANTLDRSYSSVYRELSRFFPGEYTAEKAQIDAAEKNMQKRKKSAQQVKRWSYIKAIRSCLQLKPDATVEEIAKAAGCPTEWVEEYLDDVETK